MSFFEVVRQVDGVRMQEFAWQDILDRLIGMPVADRTRETPDGDTLIGTTMTVDGSDHLVLSRIREEPPQSIHFQSGAIEELEAAAQQGFIETTVVSFLGYGNALGMVRGSPSSPTVGMLESWTNLMPLVQPDRLKIRAIVSRSTIQKLARADGASKIDVRVGTSAAEAMRSRIPRLSRALEAFRREYGEVTVGLTISASGRGHDQEQERLLEDARQLGQDPGLVARARGDLLYDVDDSARAVRERVDFLAHSITAKRQIESRDAEGRVLRNHAAARAILDAAGEAEPELRLALDAADG